MLTVDFNLLGIKKGDLVLDAGCGHGRHSIEFIIRGADVISMDLDCSCLKKTRQALDLMINSMKKDKTGTYLVHSGDALNLPFKDETFDNIICSEVMEHVEDDNRACFELCRVLKKNGRKPNCYSNQRTT